MVELWDPRHISERDFDVDICPMEWYPPQEIAGVFLDVELPDELWNAYWSSHAVKGRKKPQRILVISPEQDQFGNYIHTAVHEFAHCVRHMLRPLYAYPLSADDNQNMEEVIEFLSVKAGRRSPASDHMKRMIRGYQRKRLVECEEVMQRLRKAIFPARRRGSGRERLFGPYAMSERQYDISHDPLFYLLFYLLDRKAHDSGLYRRRSAAKISRTF